MACRWIIAPAWERRVEAAKRLGVSPLVAQVLHNRGLDDPQAARRFLNPQLKDLLPPETLPGALEAAERIAAAVRERRRIVIYGDYDVDGITGTAILWHVLRLAGANVDYYIPHRLEEGYGLNAEAIAKLADEGAGLIITVDCGITAVEEAALAADRGLELIITDHHAATGELPRSACIVHPSATGTCYPNPHISGAGVALKLAWAIAQQLSRATKVRPEFREFLIDAVGLAALGTIADVVQLVEENRILARHGLAGLKASRHHGIAALIESAGLAGAKLNDYHVGFLLAPRLNAAGRMGHARLAAELLTRADAARAREIAIYLSEQNRRRRALEQKILKQARQMAHKQRMTSDACRAIVLAKQGWHAGVIGIVAARLVEEFSRPTVLIALEDHRGQGSARSVRHFDMHRALTACREHLISFGGHAMAAGLKIHPDRVQAFAEQFIQIANNTLTAADLQPALRLDAVVKLRELSEPTVQVLLDLGPFGVGNPKPRLATGWVDLVGEPRIVGKAGEHLQFTVAEEGVVRKAIAFGHAKYRQALLDHRRCRLAFEPILNEFNGRRSVELQVLDVQLPQPAAHDADDDAHQVRAAQRRAAAVLHAPPRTSEP